MKSSADWTTAILIKIKEIVKHNIRNLAPVSLACVIGELFHTTRASSNSGSWFRYFRSLDFYFNRSFVGFFLRAYKVASRYFSPQFIWPNIQEVEQLCNQIMNQFKYLDLQTTESLVLGLALTKSWKDGLKLLKNVETLGIPTVLSFSALAKAAIINNEFDIALNVMNQVIDLQKYLHDFVYVEWIEKSDSEKLFTLLDFWGTSEVFPQKLVIDKLKQKFSEFQYSVRETSVSTKGCCTVCNKQLKSAALSVDQYKNLQQKFFDKVLTGSDVFIGSSPQEIERFQTLVKQTAPFDIVIDGLNVAYKNNYKEGRSKVEAVRHVVNYFASKGKKILVLGKIHLRKWSALLMKDIETKATVFLTDNLSRDDPFMLYAALYSGPVARVLSHDLMRDHTFRLGDPSSAALFRQWRRSCQLDLVSVSKSGRVVLQYPLRHLTAAQCNDGTWHVPYEDGSQRLAQQLPDTWLCIEKMNK
nr:EOG090X0CGF [Eulimnadia texana]